MKLNNLFSQTKPLIGMIHVHALPGTPKQCETVQEISATACKEALLFQEEGMHAIILENMHDIPYLNRHVGPEIVATMTAVAVAVRQCVDLPCGIQILAGANHAALAIAHAAKLQFIRAEGFVFAHIADEGMMNSDAGALLRYRKQIGAENVAIFTDIKKKHCAHTITHDVSIADTAHAAEFFLSDGIIITGAATGRCVDHRDIQNARTATTLPLLLGSGITSENLPDYWDEADGFIIGSALKKNGYWENDVNREQVQKMVAVAKKLKGSIE